MQSVYGTLSYDNNSGQRRRESEDKSRLRTLTFMQLRRYNVTGVRALSVATLNYLRRPACYPNISLFRAGMILSKAKAVVAGQIEEEKKTETCTGQDEGKLN